MNAIPCPFPPQWTPQQIAAAVPQRLYELDLSLCRVEAGGAANQPGTRRWHRGYLRRGALPALFRVHG